MTKTWRGISRKAGLSKDNTKAIRRWAAENEVSVSSRGRIKADVVQQYLASLS